MYYTYIFAYSFTYKTIYNSKTETNHISTPLHFIGYSYALSHALVVVVENKVSTHFGTYVVIYSKQQLFISHK